MLTDPKPEGKARRPVTPDNPHFPPVAPKFFQAPPAPPRRIPPELLTDISRHCSRPCPKTRKRAGLCNCQNRRLHPDMADAVDATRPAE